MQSILKSIRNKSKFLFFAFIAVVFFFLTPQTAFAGWFDWASWGTNAVVNGIATVALLYFFWIPLLFTLLFATITNIFLQAAIAFATIGTSYLHSDAVNIGWPIIRDLANMMIVLGFVVVGIAFTLRVESYGSKKILINLIIAALLINFSLLICGIFIDGSNILMNYFFNKAGGSSFSKWLPTVDSLWTVIKNIGTDNVLNFAVKIVGMMIFYFVVGLVNILYFFLVLGRVIALWILVILSPLAFVCAVFPATKNIWQKWRDNFFQWCVIIIPAGLFYYIGVTLVNASFEKHGAFEIDSSSTYVNFISNAVSTVFVPSAFLIIGFLVSLQFSAMGSKAITGFANKHYKTALKMGGGMLSKSGSTVGSLAGWASDKTGGNASRVGRMFSAISTTANKQQATSDAFKGRLDKTRSDFGRLTEKIGVKNVGTTDIAESKMIEEKATKYSAAYATARVKGDNALMEKIREVARTGKGVEKTAAIMAVADNKDLHATFKNSSGKFDAMAANDAISHAEKNGAAKIREKALKQAPTIEEHNVSSINKIKQNHPTWSTDQAKHEAVVRAVAKMSEEELDRNFIDSIDHTILSSSIDRMTDKKKTLLKANNSESLLQEIKSLNNKRNKTQEERDRMVSLSQKARAIISKC